MTSPILHLDLLWITVYCSASPIIRGSFCMYSWVSRHVQFLNFGTSLDVSSAESAIARSRRKVFIHNLFNSKITNRNRLLLKSYAQNYCYYLTTRWDLSWFLQELYPPWPMLNTHRVWTKCWNNSPLQFQNMSYHHCNIHHLKAQHEDSKVSAIYHFRSQELTYQCTDGLNGTMFWCTILHNKVFLPNSYASPNRTSLVRYW